MKPGKPNVQYNESFSFKCQAGVKPGRSSAAKFALDWIWKHSACICWAFIGSVSEPWWYLCLWLQSWVMDPVQAVTGDGDGGELQVADVKPGWASVLVLYQLSHIRTHQKWKLWEILLETINSIKILKNLHLHMRNIGNVQEFADPLLYLNSEKSQKLYIILITGNFYIICKIIYMDLKSENLSRVKK